MKLPTNSEEGCEEAFVGWRRLEMEEDHTHQERGGWEVEEISESAKYSNGYLGMR